MLDRIKFRLGILFPIAASAVCCVAIFLLSRLALIGWQWGRFAEFGDMSSTLLGGLRIDLATVSYLLILPSFLACFFLSENKLGQGFKTLFRVWITAGIWLLIYMEVATFPFIQEYDLRPNRLFIEYLVYPKEISSMLWNGYKLELFVGLVVSAIALLFGWTASKYMVSNLRYPKWYWRPVIAVLVLAIGVMGARSTLGHRPLNPAMVAYSTDPLVNDLTLNSVYSVLFAAKQMASENDAFDYYPKLPADEIVKRVQASIKAEKNTQFDSALPTYAYHESSFKQQPKNIVILLLESHGARYVSELGGKNLSPTLDKLYKEGWGFTNLYATGTRSVRGIEAVTTGFVPTPSRSTVKLAKSQQNFFTIADLLQSRGYTTQFVYGGESHFDNMKSFFLGNGFNDIQDLPTFDQPKFIGSWGASDQDLYDHAHKGFTEMNKQGKPFFSLVFSSSNHTPFEYPDNVIEQYNEPKQTVENAVKYADFALGEFIEKAKKSDYWDNTVFVAIADHDARVYGTQAVPVENFHIPAVIFGGGVEQKQDDRLVSQLDIPPTLLSLAGISAEHPMVGFDLTKEVPADKQRALMQRGKTFAWMDANREVIVFKPQDEPKSYQYEKATQELTPIEVNSDKLSTANAYALWGSFAYKNGLYAQKDQY